jgi:two-component system response regulator RegA
MVQRKVPPRVLVVDDESLIRWALAESLRAAGYEVIEAGTVAAADAVAADAHGALDAAVVDLRLPDGSGLDVLETLHASWPGCRSILMTAYGTTESHDAAAARGAVAVVGKPFDLGDIMRLIASAVQDGRP